MTQVGFILQKKIYTLEKYLCNLIEPRTKHAEGEKNKTVCRFGIEAVSTQIGYKDLQEVKEYLDHLDDQNKNLSLSKFEGILKVLEDALETDPEGIPLFIWNHSIHSTANSNVKIMADIISFTLTDFAANIRYSTPPNNNHERTPFVEFIVPMFKYFSKVTKLLHFGWCEKFSKSIKYARIELLDSDIEVAPSRFAEGLGYTQVTGNEEVFMESSSGIEDEVVTHTLEDTAKLILLCTNSLSYIISKNQQARFETFIDKSSFGIQIIKHTVTLTKTSVLQNELKWKVIELRSSQYPVSWDIRYKWIKMFELLATLFIELMEPKKIDFDMKKVTNGLGTPGKTVREHFSESDSTDSTDPMNTEI